MSTLTTRASKGSALTNSEMDDNFNNLNNDKLQLTSDTAISGATITPVGTVLIYTVTALAEAATIAAPSGTPVNGWRLLLRIKDDGTGRALSWNSIYRAIGLTLPSTTVANKTHYHAMIYNSADAKWDVVAYAVEA